MLRVGPLGTAPVGVAATAELRPESLPRASTAETAYTCSMPLRRPLSVHARGLAADTVVSCVQVAPESALRHTR